MCTIQEQSRGKSFLERFLSNSQNQKKIDSIIWNIVEQCGTLWIIVEHIGKFYKLGCEMEEKKGGRKEERKERRGKGGGEEGRKEEN